ncbi:MAG: enoyl-CoA hydratase/isomerase family protein, partial [Chloroflexi bacterium]|nr:enoyl-CoA hydratase/isomerase family protein [Chloroflexota bacterium]
ELEDLFAEVTLDDDVNAIVLTGAGKGFCSGGDVGTMGKARQASDMIKEHPPIREARKLIGRMLDVEQPIVAAVNGHAVGLGATLALFCDLIVVSETAKIADTHVGLGVVAADGGAVIWPLLCGMARAKEHLLLADPVTGKEAERIGLVNYAVPPDQVMPKAMDLARRLADQAPRAVRWTKMACNKRIREEVNLTLDFGLAAEMVTFMTEDHKEAVAAFKEKRKPVFKGY